MATLEADREEEMGEGNKRTEKIATRAWPRQSERFLAFRAFSLTTWSPET